MKTPEEMTLQERIYTECREEVLKIKDFSMGWDEYVDTFPSSVIIPDLLQEASTLALNTQAEFFRWASQEYWYADNVDRWIGVDDLMRENQITELELYDIWRRDAE